MSDRRTRGVPERWLLPPPPADVPLATRWRSFGFDQRRALARADIGDLDTLPPEDREVVVGLARRRLSTGWRLSAVSFVLGWLVLMSVWGFGRSTFPTEPTRWLLAGLVLGAVTAIAALAATRRRLRRARSIVRADGDRARGDDASF